MNGVDYAGAEYWDQSYRQRLESGEAYLRELLAGWQQVRLEPVLVPHRATGGPFKHVWRGIACR